MLMSTSGAGVPHLNVDCQPFSPAHPARVYALVCIATATCSIHCHHPLLAARPVNVNHTRGAAGAMGVHGPLGAGRGDLTQLATGAPGALAACTVVV